MNIIVPVVVVHELDYISRRNDDKASAARCARSFLERFMSSQRSSSGVQRSTITLQEMIETGMQVTFVVNHQLHKFMS